MIKKLNIKPENIKSEKYLIRKHGKYTNIYNSNVINVDVEFDNPFLEKYNSQYKEFLSVFGNFFNPKYFSAFNYNIKRVKREKSPISKFKARKNNIDSFYSPENNSIYMENDDTKIYSELFQLASTRRDDEFLYSGFNKAELAFNNDDGIGYALNEGYTELLTRRFFSVKDENKSYQYLVARLLELAVGKNKLQNMYLKGDSEGLINELTKHTTAYAAFKFINDLDMVCEEMSNKDSSSKLEDISNRLHDINLFLTDIFAAKLNDQYSKGKINSVEMFNESLSKYISYLPNNVEKNNKEFSTLKTKEEFVNRKKMCINNLKAKVLNKTN